MIKFWDFILPDYSQPFFVGLSKLCLERGIGFSNVSDVILKATLDFSDVISCIAMALVETDDIRLSVEVLVSKITSPNLILLFNSAKVYLFSIGKVIWNVSVLIAVFIDIFKCSNLHSFQSWWNTIFKFIKGCDWLVLERLSFPELTWQSSPFKITFKCFKNHFSSGRFW